MFLTFGNIYKTPLFSKNYHRHFLYSRLNFFAYFRFQHLVTVATALNLQRAENMFTCTVTIVYHLEDLSAILLKP